MKKTLLWVDDKRDPNWPLPWSTNHLTLADYYNPIGGDVDVIWVKSYNEFVDYINQNGIPDGVCFDHDLGTKKTGLDCVKYLTIKCMDNDVDIPAYSIQSSNPVGRDNINSLMKSYHKLYLIKHS